MLSSLIHFRSRYEGTHQSDWGTKNTRWRSSEIQWIRSYSIGDDPRDIAWKRGAGMDTLYTKERESSLHPDVILISLLDDDTLWFSTDTYPSTKYDFLTELEKNISESARILRFPYEYIYTLEGIWENTIEKSLIIIVGDIESTDRIREIGNLAKKNDIIFLFLLHPTEIRPEKHMLFESKKTGKKYHDALKEYREKAEQEAMKHNIAFLPCTTEDVPSLLLNHFFKYRYV